MGEPLSIVGFTIGAIGFLAAVRNGIETLMKDKDRFKGDLKQLYSFEAHIELAMVRLETWKSNWLIDEVVVQQVFEDYWGEKGSRVIENLLGTIEERSRDVQAEFIRIFGIPNMNSRPREMEQETLQALSPEDRAQKMRRSIMQFKKDLGFTKRLQNTWYAEGIFESHVKSLDTDVQNLTELSTTTFMLRHNLNQRADWRLDMEYIKRKAVLIDIAENSAVCSSALLRICTQDHRDFAELCLDAAAELEAPSLDAEIAEWAGYSRIPYYLRLPVTCPAGNLTSLSSIRVDVYDVDGREPHSLTRGHPRQILQSSCYCGKQDCQQRCFGEAPDGPWFRTRYKTDATFKSENLRSFISSNRSDFQKNLHGSFSKSERTTLAYHLAKSALLMLQTKWLSTICSCTVMRRTGQTNSFPVSYSVRVGCVVHLEPGTGIFQRNQKQWCEEDFNGMMTKRLGILLTEIGIGRTIADAGFHPTHNVVEVDFEVEKDIDETKTYLPSGIAARVSREAGTTFGKVVKWCLTQDCNGRPVTSRQVGSFYDHVVWPLYVQYDAEVIKRNERRRKRQQA